jgi:hypothetical protein
MENPPPHPRDEVRFFWTGPPLSFYEILSLKSFLSVGARVILYSYDSGLSVPEGVELHDAGELLPDEILKRHNAGSDKGLSRHSDLFRYIMLQRHGGWYVDLDVICLRDRLPPAEMYFARADADIIYNGIMKFPAGCPVLDDVIARAAEILSVAAQAVTEEARVVLGPPLFSRVLREHGLDVRAEPRSKAYEIPFQEALSFFNPSQCGEIEARLAGKDFTHLWNGAWATLRIPKNYGPPQGSWLDMMFRRLGIKVSDHGRLQYDALVSWVMEDCLLEEFKARAGGNGIGKEQVAAFAAEMERIGWQPRDRLYRPPQAKADATLAGGPQLPAQTNSPQIVRTFWHGAQPGPYQLLCLKSFADRGHRVEVFTYQCDVRFADGLHVRDAREILPEARVLRPLADGKPGIHANLFRYALLERLGGWWIDPDVMLMQPDLPGGDIYLASPDVFRRTPVKVLKFPANHPLMVEARRRADALDDDPAEWERAGAGLLSELAARSDILSQAKEGLGPISWLNVPDLFNPDKRDELHRAAAEGRFLHLQDEVWRRSGIPSQLAPPEGSYLADLLERHGIEADFPARITFDQVNRWVRHMYRAAGLERA